MKALIPSQTIEHKIYFLRGYKIMLDRDLAALYGVTTYHLNQAVTRNPDRFPPDFMFVLNRKEAAILTFQFGTPSWGGTRKPPRAFTEHGILSLSSVLNSQRAVQVNIAIMRAFVKLRQMIAGHKELGLKLAELEQRVSEHDESIHEIFTAIRKILEPVVHEKPKRKIGFHSSVKS